MREDPWNIEVSLLERYFCSLEIFGMVDSRCWPSIECPGFSWFHRWWRTWFPTWSWRISLYLV